MIYVGIDNGVSGALGIVFSDGSTDLRELPTKSELNYQKAGKNITRLDWEGFSQTLEAITSLAPISEIRIVLEKPFVNPGNFVATSTSLRCLEAELVVIEQLGLSRQYIDAKTWQKELLPNVTGRKELKKASLDIGIRAYPHLTAKIKKQHDADALFIAVYAKQHNL